MLANSGIPQAIRGRFMTLVDGENLVFRAQEMMAGGKNLVPRTVHIPDVFLWNQGMLQPHLWQCIRTSYYTSAVGAENHIVELENEKSKVLVTRIGDGAAQICPRVFKKDSKSRKVKLVDISITIDALRHAYHKHVDAIYLITGDGDYLPLIREIMRTGTQVWLGAVSNGLNPDLPRAADRFLPLDEVLFSN